MSTSEEVKQKFDRLVEKRDEAKTQIVQLETRIESTKESISQIETEWKEKYGINSPEEAEQICSKLEEEINGILEKCEKYLDKVEG